MVILGAKPSFCDKTKYKYNAVSCGISLSTCHIRKQKIVAVDEITATFKIDTDVEKNAKNLTSALEKIGDTAVKYAKNNGIIIVSDLAMEKDNAPIPMLMAIASINNRLIKGLRFQYFMAKTGQAVSSHDTAVIAASVRRRLHQQLI